MRTTRTQSGRDSAGVVRLAGWELEGRTYLFVVAGAIGSVMAFLLAYRLGLALRLLVGLAPLGCCCGWVHFFVAGKPPHYAEDRITGLLCGCRSVVEEAVGRPRVRQQVGGAHP
jgi:hypothetical protein